MNGTSTLVSISRIAYRQCYKLNSALIQKGLGQRDENRFFTMLLNPSFFFSGEGFFIYYKNFASFRCFHLLLTNQGNLIEANQASIHGSNRAKLLSDYWEGNK